jgi:FHS family glucose/mannose:H+ symporter-like MFS transporter
MKAPGLVLNASFALTGALTTLLGPLLPSLISQWSLADRNAGRLFATQFFSATLGAALQGWITSRIRATWCLTAAYALMAVSVATLTAGSFAMGVVRVALYGFALGVTIPTVNLIAGQRAPARKTAALNLLNMCWCAGAVFAPLLIGALLPSHGLPSVLMGFGGLLLAAALLTLAFPVGAGPGASPSPEPGLAPARGVSAAWLVAVFLFVYVGVENTVSGWISVFALRVLQLPIATASAALSVFWTALMMARGYLAFGRRIPAARVLLVGSLCAAVAGTAALVLSSGPLWLIAGAALAGAGLGPVFPGIVALYQDRAGAERSLGLVFAFAGCGGAVLPWLAGLLSSSAHDPRATMWVGLIATMLLLVLLKPAMPGRVRPQGTV